MAESVWDLALKYRGQLRADNDEASKRMAMMYGQMYERLSTQLRALQVDIADRVARGQPMSPDWLRRQHRFGALLDQVDDEIRRFGGYSQAEVRALVDRGVTKAERDALALVMKGAPRAAPSIATSWNTLPTDALVSSVGMFTAGGPIATRLDQFGVDMRGRVELALVESITMGDSPLTLAKRFRTELGMGLSSALRWARTAQIQAYREATAQIYEANSDVVRGWTWVAAMDPARTCLACVAMHGTIHPVGERMNDHWCGWCVQVPYVASYKELGVNSPGPPQPHVQKGQNYIDQHWTAAQKRALMGDDLYEAWAKKQVKLSDMVTTRTDAVWGSVITAKSRGDLQALIPSKPTPPKPKPKSKAVAVTKAARTTPKEPALPEVRPAEVPGAGVKTVYKGKELDDPFKEVKYKDRMVPGWQVAGPPEPGMYFNKADGLWYKFTAADFPDATLPQPRPGMVWKDGEWHDPGKIRIGRTMTRAVFGGPTSEGTGDWDFYVGGDTGKSWAIKKTSGYSLPIEVVAKLPPAPEVIPADFVSLAGPNGRYDLSRVRGRGRWTDEVLERVWEDRSGVIGLTLTREEDLRREFYSSETEMTKIRDGYFKQTGSTMKALELARQDPEYIRLLELRGAATAELNAIRESRGTMFDWLRAEEGFATTISWEAGAQSAITGTMRKKVLTGIDGVAGMIDRRIIAQVTTGNYPSLNNLTNVKVRFLRNGARAYHGGTTIYVAPNDQAWVSAHEWGHHLEDYLPGARVQVSQFLKDRVGDEKLRPLGGGYGSDEEGWRDKFLDKYMGKYYSRGSTEILSMGVQYLFDDPARLYQKDPGMFKFIWQVLNGGRPY